MSMLAGQVDYVIGVDTHRGTNTAAVVTHAGAVVAQQQCTTDAMGYRRVVAFADEHAPGPPGLGDRGHRQLRLRADNASAGARRVGCRDRQASPAGTPKRRQDR